MLRFASSHRRLLVGVSAVSGTAVLTIVRSFQPSSTSGSNSTRLEESAAHGSDIPPPVPLPTRQQQLQRLASTKQFDVLVIGGGATGSGIALDAQLRGLDTALVERGDFSCETSARSTKLIWAGIRYIATAVAQLLRWSNLQHPVEAVQDFVGEFNMVLGAHRERRFLLENNPHLTHWVPIAIPMKTWIQTPPPFGHPLFCLAPLVFPAVMKFYDALSGFTCPPSHIMGKARARRKFPQLDEDVKYMQVFYEGQHNDARTATCIALTAAEEGACITNYTEMIGILREHGGDKGKAIGIQCRDTLTGHEFSVYAKTIIFAGGPFTDGMRQLEDPASQPAVAAAAGTHIILPGYYCADGIGMLDINTSDGRFLFFLPWEGSTIVGTTDRKGPVVSSPGAPEDEIEWLLKETKKYLADDLKVRRADVLSAWQGFRPLASDPHAAADAPISRDHVISTNPDTNITFITGGKWTTYREMAQDVLDRVVAREPELQQKAGRCQTETHRLRGGVGYTRNVPIRLVQEFGISQDTAEHLARTYGVHAFEVCRLTKPTGQKWPRRFGHVLVEGYPYLECEVEYACRHEMACTVTDMLTLRTRLAYLNSEAARAVAPKVADLMATHLRWSRAETKRQLAAAEQAIAEFGGPVPHQVGTKLDSIKDLTTLFKALDMDQNGYFDFEEMKLMAQKLGFPFASEKEALETFQRMDVEGHGRVREEAFVLWWKSSGARNDKLHKLLENQFKANPEDLGKGPRSRGTMFG